MARRARMNEAGGRVYRYRGRDERSGAAGGRSVRAGTCCRACHAGGKRACARAAFSLSLNRLAAECRASSCSTGAGARVSGGEGARLDGRTGTRPALRNATHGRSQTERKRARGPEAGARRCHRSPVARQGPRRKGQQETKGSVNARRSLSRDDFPRAGGATGRHELDICVVQNS